MIDPDTRLSITRLLMDIPDENIPPQLLPILVKGAVQFLRETPETENIELLVNTSAASPSTLAQQYALTALTSLAQSANMDACDAIYQLAVIYDNLSAQQHIQQYHLKTLQPDLEAGYWFLKSDITTYKSLDLDYMLLTGLYISSAEQVRTRLRESAQLIHEENWVDIVHCLGEENQDKIEKIVNHFSHYSEHEQKLVRWLVIHSIENGRQEFVDGICDLIIRYDDQELINYAIQRDLKPQDRLKSALFLFLTEQWEEYERQDFNFTLLRSAFNDAPSYLRKKILIHSRLTGYTGWMRESGSHFTNLRSIADLSDADWQLAFERLMAKKACEEIWTLAQAAPPVWSTFFLAGLPEEWQPGIEAENRFFQKVKNLARICQKFRLMRPDSIRINTSSEIRCLIISPQDTFFATGDSQGEISFWLLASGQPYASFVKSPIAQIRALAISPDNTFISCANQDHQIRTFRITDGKLLKTFKGHRGFIRSVLFDQAGFSLLSASFDGSIIAWRFPQGSIKWQHTPNQGEIFGMKSTRDGNWIVFSSSASQLSLLSCSDGKMIRQLEAHTAQVTLISASLSGSIAAGYAMDKKIILWNLRSGKKILGFNTGEPPLTAIILHPNENFLLGSTTKGDIIMWSVSNGSELHRWKAHQDAIVDMTLNKDGNYLVSAAKNGEIAIWKLNTFYLAFQPVSSHPPGVLSQIRNYQAGKKIEEIEKNWLEYTRQMIEWNQRYDIEIDGPARIEIGEFDIEL